MSDCKKIRDRLAAEGPEAAEIAKVALHLEGCADCRAFLDKLRELEVGLGELDLPDAPDALAEKTMEAVRGATKEAKPPPARRRRRATPWIVGGLAASFVGVMGFMTLNFMGAQRASFERGIAPEYRVVEPENFFSGGAEEGEIFALNMPPPESVIMPGRFRPGDAAIGAGEGAGVTGADKDYGGEIGLLAELDGNLRADRKPRESGWVGEKKERQKNQAAETEALLLQELGEVLADQSADAETSAEAPPTVDTYKPLMQQSSQATAGAGASTASKAKPAPEPAPDSAPALSFYIPPAMLAPSEEAAEPERRLAEKAKRDDVSRVLDDVVAPESSPIAELGTALRYYGNRAGDMPAEGYEPARALAADFLARHRSLDGLTFQEPVGYWANTYIPGDPAIRLLAAKLRGWSRYGFGLEEDVRPLRQPFDAPQDAAMAVYLNADAPAVDGPTRMRIQVGLKGADRQGGRRPAMNVGLVVDLRHGASPEVAARIRALIAAFQEARQPDDRFSLIVAGPGGGLVTPPEDFRHGPLRVAMERMFGGDATMPAMGLQEAVALAAETVRKGDDPAAVLGSSLVLLATGSSLAEDFNALESMAHRNAVTGVPFSVVGLAANENPGQIDRLVAAGQGNRRVLDSAQAADGLVDRELHAASRAIARAVRLRIRLAPGVKLIDVLGSRRLPEPQAQRVREAEQSIDRRLSRNLGIQSDRGEDEEGIQIVIPAFQAGDDHAILLDVVVDRAGPVADVTVRYKDVIHLKNGVARASLSVGRGEGVAGPLELNVMKNLVAREYALRIREAGQYLAAGDQANAYEKVTALRDLIVGLQAEVPGWRGDPDLAADVALLTDYLAVLRSPALADAVQRSHVAASLRYSAFRKIQHEAR